MVVGCLPWRAGHQARPKARGATGARCPAFKADVRHPATAQVRTAEPFALDGRPRQRLALPMCGDVVVPIDNRDWAESVSPSPRRAAEATP